MEEALRVLTLSESCPTDALFVSQVRLQLVKQRADHVRQQDETDITGTVHTAFAPRFLYVKTLRQQLHELKTSFKPASHQIGEYPQASSLAYCLAGIAELLPKTDILNTHAQYVELYINQLAYSISRDCLALKSPGQTGGSDPMLGFQRIECLWQSVECIKAWLDAFYTIPCSQLLGQPFHFWSQMILNITLLKYLSTLQDPEWDCQAVRNTVDLISTMDCMLQKLTLISKEPELQCDDHLLTYLSKLFTKCREWAECRWNPPSQIQDVEPSSQSAGTTGQAHHIPDLDQIFWMQSMDLGDDQWLDSVLSIPMFP